MGEKRLDLFVGVSLLFAVMLAGCGARAEHITLAAATEAATTPAASPTLASGTATAMSATTAGGSLLASATAVPPTPVAPPTVEHEMMTEAPSEEPTNKASPTPEPSPTPTATPTPGPIDPPSDGMAIVTLAEHDRTAMLHPGDRLVLTLGDGYRWTLSVSGITVLVPIANSMLPPGVQAVFEARRLGRAVVAAAGTAICAHGATDCTDAVLRFELVVVVR